MTYHDRLLRRTPSMSAMAQRRHVSGCGCRRCRIKRQTYGRMEAGRLFGTPPGGLPLPNWSGWQGRLTLPRLLKLAHHLRNSRKGASNANLDKTWRAVTNNAGPMPSAVRRYFKSGRQTLYRIGHKSNTAQAVHIGMAPSSPAASRILKHMTGHRQGSKVHKAIGVPAVVVSGSTLSIPGTLDDYVVHVGQVSPSLSVSGTPDYRMLHVYETLLQKRELPTSAYRKIARSWSFED